MHVETGTRREMPMEKTDASKPSKGGAPRVACDYHLSNERHMTSSEAFGCAGIERRCTMRDLCTVSSAGLRESEGRSEGWLRWESKGASESAFLGDASKGTGPFSAGPPAIDSSPLFIGRMALRNLDL